MSSVTLDASFAGSVYNNVISGFTNCRNAASGNGTQTDFIVCRTKKEADGSSFSIKRGVVVFNTSTLPDNATVSSAVLRLYSTFESDTVGGVATADVVSVNLASDSSLSNDDFNDFGTTVLSYVETSAPGFGTATPNTYKSFTLATNLISLTGNTRFGIREKKDVISSEPINPNTSNEFIFQVTTNVPHLDLVYTTPPAVTTGVVSALQPISATLAGNVTDAGGGTVSERGVCWSTTSTPTTSNSKATSAGTTGTYTVGATGLLPGTLYYYRAYVITENSTQYGAEASFRTPGGAILFNLL